MKESLAEELRNRKVINEKDLRWLKGSRISRDDCLNKRRTVEYADIFEGCEKKEIVSFGKFKGQTYDWIKQNQPRYYEWASENIKGFNK